MAQNNVFLITNQLDFNTYRNNNKLLPPSQCDTVKLIFGSGTFTITRSELMNFEGYRKVEIVGDNQRVITQNAAGSSSYSDHKTIIEITQSFSNVYDTNNHYTDDAVIRILSEKNVGLEVNISDVLFKSDISRAAVINGSSFNSVLNSSQFVWLKVANANSVKMVNVTSELRYLRMSNVLLRRCDNISIQNCEFINYSCRNQCSNLMISQGCRNVEIANNVFRKFGNDECLWFGPTNGLGQLWTDTAGSVYYDKDDTELDDRTCPVENVLVANNLFYYTNYDGTTKLTPIDISTANNNSPIKGYDETEGVWSRKFNDVFVSLYSAQDGCLVENNALTGEVIKTYCRTGHFTMKNIHFSNNEFHISAPLSNLITFGIDRFTVVDDIQLTNNVIRYYNLEKCDIPTSAGNALTTSDFRFLFDRNYSIDSEPLSDINQGILDPYQLDMTRNCFKPIIVSGNDIHFERKCEQFYQDDHIFILNEGMKIVAKNNNLTYSDKIYNSTNTNEKETYFARRGFVLFRTNYKGGEVVLKNNFCNWIKNVLSGSGIDGSIGRVVVRSYNNTFVGDTRSSFNNVDEAYFDLKGNKYYSYYYSMIFEMFATKGKVVFEDNIVKKIGDTQKEASTTGIIYANWGSESEQAQIQMEFYSSGNHFPSNPSTDVYVNLAGKSNVKLLRMGNRYSDTTD